MRELVSRLLEFAAGPLRGHGSWRFWAAPEGLLGASWRLLGAFLGPLGGSFEALGGSWGVLGPLDGSWVLSCSFLAAPGRLWAPLGGVLGPLWAGPGGVLGTSGQLLGAS